SPAWCCQPSMQIWRSGSLTSAQQRQRTALRNKLVTEEGRENFQDQFVAEADDQIGSGGENVRRRGRQAVAMCTSLENAICPDWRVRTGAACDCRVRRQNQAPPGPTACR